MAASLCYLQFVRGCLKSLLEFKEQHGEGKPLPSSLWSGIEESFFVVDHCTERPQIVPPPALEYTTSDSHAIDHLAKIGDEFLQSERAYIQFLEITDDCYYQSDSSCAQIFQQLSSRLSGIIQLHNEIIYEIDENATARSEARMINPSPSELDEFANFQFSPPPAVSPLQTAYPRDITSLCHELNRRSTYGLIGDICHQLYNRIEAFKSYGGYIEEYSHLLKTLGDHKKSTSFQEYLDACNETARGALPQADSRIRLEDLMIMPVQRIPRYILFLKEMLKYIDSENHLQFKLKECMEELEKLVGSIDRLREEREIISRLSEIKRLVKMPYRNVFELKDAKDRRVVYDSPITRLVREGEEITATKVHLFLLNDLMLIATNPAGINYQMQMMMMQTGLPTPFRGNGASSTLRGNALTFRAIVPFRNSSMKGTVSVESASTEGHPFGFIVRVNYESRIEFVEHFVVNSRKENHVWMQEFKRTIDQQASLPLLEKNVGNDLLELPAMGGWLLQKRNKVNLWQIKFFQCRGNSLFAFTQSEDAQEGNFVSRYDLRDSLIKLIPKFGFEVSYPSTKSSLQQFRVCDQADIVLRQWLGCFIKCDLEVDKSKFESTPISQEDAEVILQERGVLNVKEWAKLRPRSSGPLSGLSTNVRANLSIIEKYNPINYSLLDILDQ